MAKLDLIISDLRRRIRDAGFRPGDMIPTQKELAREMGVSVVTMGHAMRFLQEEGVIASIRGKGTIINALPEISKPLSVGVIVTNSTLDDPVLKGPMSSLQLACQNAGRTTETFVVSPQNRAQLHEWAKEFSGCIAFGTTKPEIVNLIGSLGKPIVFYGEMHRGSCPPWASQVTVSVEAIAAVCLQFVHSIGHRRLLLVRSRGTSYLESLGLHFEEQAEELGCTLEQFTVSLDTDGHDVAEHLTVSSFEPTVIIIDGGMRAGRILHQLALAGLRVPEDISLIALNGVAPEYLITRDLSRIENAPRRVGNRLLRVLDTMIEGGMVTREEILPSLVWGRTCLPRPELLQGIPAAAELRD